MGDLALSNSAPDRYGVMGFPVSHSRSPVIHRLFAIQTGQNIQYELLQVAPDNLESAIRQFQSTGGQGLNVTLPHKQAVTALVDRASARARVAGAINTLVFRDRQIYGDNTDGVGLQIDLAENMELDLESANVLILGAGGATRGIVAPLLEINPRQLVIANRTVSRAEAIVEDFKEHGPVSARSFDDVGAESNFDLIINATSAGVNGETPPYPATAVSANTVCYDLSYGLDPTPFVKWASDQGAARSMMGWGMLVEQAAASFQLWRGVKPDTEPVLAQMTVSI